MYLGVFNRKLCVVFVVYGVNVLVVFGFGGYSLNFDFFICINNVYFIGGECRVYSVFDIVVVLLLDLWLVMLKVVFFLIVGR